MRSVLPALSLLLLVGSCEPEGPDAPSGPSIDLTEAVPTGEARAAVITQPEALFGGVAADGRVGDLMLINDRVRFIVQSTRTDGSYFVQTGGGVIDADIVRPATEPGRDLLDEYVPMLGAGRVMDTASVTVVEDGLDGGPAVVRVEGVEAPLDLLEGTLESPGFLPNDQLTFVTTYTLPPDTHLLHVRTEVGTEGDEPVELELGDLMMGSADAAWAWNMGTGLDARGGAATQGAAWVGKAHDAAVGLFALPGEALEAGSLSLLEGVADIILGFSDDLTLEPGGTVAFERLYGAGPDMATLTSDRLRLGGGATTPVQGQVTAPDGPVPGAWVAVSVDGAPQTVAVTDADGAFEVLVEEGADAEARAIGRASGYFLDGPGDQAWYPPHGGGPTQQRALDSWSAGTALAPPAEGRGVGSDDAPLTLGEPATVRLTVDDGAPFFAELIALDPSDPVDPALVPPEPRGGRPALAWSRDGDVEVQVPAGEYAVLAHRGLRYELFEGTVTATAGEVAEVSFGLPKAYEHPGWLLGDPHSHASPSADASTGMAHRVLAQAGYGLQVHFGTDHDHVADYRPLVDTLGLTPHLASVVSDEVSPPLRGHMNIYPLQRVPDEANGGAWLWWSNIPESTEAILDALFEHHGEDIVVQANHPTDDGVVSSAQWDVGVIGRPTHWTERLGAMEVLNSADYDEFLPAYLDLLVRGYVVTPTGVSDAHGPTSGHQGISATFLGVGTDDPTELTDDALVEAFRSRRTQVTRGPFLDLSIDPGTVLTAPDTLTVEALSPSWIVVDRLQLLRDGEVVETVEGTSATFDLTADDDASFVVIAEGDSSMLPVDGVTPWAMSAAIFLDMDGGGYDGSLPPLSYED